jgi:hypothetical protein
VMAAKGCVLVATCLIVGLMGVRTAAADDQYDPACGYVLSKQAKAIYRKVVEKGTANNDLKEVTKEVARDLITNNVLGREEATAPAAEALACLENERR